MASGRDGRSQSFWHSKSTVALSVSISQKTSPALTSSPSATVHEAFVPAVMVGDRDGSPTTVWSGTARAQQKGSDRAVREVSWAARRSANSWGGQFARLLRLRAKTPHTPVWQVEVCAGSLRRGEHAAAAMASHGAAWRGATRRAAAPWHSTMPATDSSLKGPKPVALCAIQLLLSWRLRVTYRERRARRAVDSAPRASIEGSTELSSVPELAGAERTTAPAVPCYFQLGLLPLESGRCRIFVVSARNSQVS